MFKKIKKMSIAKNLTKIKSQLPAHVTLVAVSKTKPVSDLMEAYNAGQRIFGENKIPRNDRKMGTNAKRYRMAYDWSRTNQ